MACLLVTLLASATALRVVPLPRAPPRCAAPRLCAIDAATLERQSEVLEVLTGANDFSLVDHEDPTAAHDVVSLGLVRRVGIDAATSGVLLAIELPPEAAAAGAADRLQARCVELLRAELSWVAAVAVEFEAQAAAPNADGDVLETLRGDDGKLDAVAPESDSPLQRLGETLPGGEEASGEAAAGEAPGVGGVGHIVAVASCKGGVGKSTTAVNLAYSLSARGLRVGLCDLDVHGPSLPTMVTPDAPLVLDGDRLRPLMSRGVKLMSMGYINPGSMPLRGAKVTPVVQQLVGRTAWGDLDFLIVDMPPGTGDVQLTLSQDFRVSAAVLVTTPQRLSFVDVVKGVEMFDKVGIPTVAVVENMCGLSLRSLQEPLEAIVAKGGVSEAAAAELRALLGAPVPLFGDSHVTKLREMWGIASSFSLPLLPDVAASADHGVPFVVSSPSCAAAATYAELAAAVQAEVGALEGLQLPALMYSTEQALVLVALADGTQQSISPHELRKACRSPTNDPSALPADLHPLDFVPMGNYAVSVRWSDGHQSLIPYASFVQ